MNTYQFTHEGKTYRFRSTAGPEEARELARQRIAEMKAANEAPSEAEALMESLAPFDTRVDPGTGDPYLAPNRDSANPLDRTLIGGVQDLVRGGAELAGLDEYLPDAVGSETRPLAGVAKGAMDLMAGVSELPGDVAEYLGFPETGAMLDEADPFNLTPYPLPSPEVRDTNTSEDTIAALTQFGVPGLGGAKLGANAARAVGSGALRQGRFFPRQIGRALDYALPMAGAAAGDFAATRPDTAETLGDVFEYEPTMIAEDDAGVPRRAKVAAEGALVAPLAGGARTVADKATGLGKWGVRNLNVLFNTQNAAERAVGEDMIRRATRPDEAMAALRARDTNPIADYNPTTAQTTQDTAFESMERFLRLRGGGIEGHAELARARDVQGRQFTGDVEETFPPRQLDETLGTVAKRENERFLREPRSRMRAAEEEIARLNDDLGALAATIPDAPGQKARAARGIVGETVARVQELNDRKRALYDAIDPDRSVPITNAPGQGRDLLAELNRILTPADAADTARARLNNQQAGSLRDIRDALQEAQDLGTPVYFKDVQGYRQEINRILRDARRAQNGRLVDELSTLKGMIDDIPRSLAAQAGRNMPATPAQAAGGVGDIGAARRAAEAERFFVEEFAPRLRRGGPAQELSKQLASGNDLDAEPIAKRFLGGTEARADQLARIMEGASPDQVDRLRQYVRDYANADLRDAVDVYGNVVPSKLDAARRSNENLAQTFPDAFSDLEDASRSGVNAARRLKDAEEARKVAEGDLKAQEKFVKASPRSLFLDGRDPGDAVMEVLKNPNASTQMRDLLGRVGLSPTDPLPPEAQEQVKAATTVALRRLLGLETGDGFEKMSRALASNEFTRLIRPGTEGRKALEQVFSPAEMEALDRFRRNASLLRGVPTGGINLKADTPDEINDLQQALRPLLASMYGIIQGNAIAKLSNLAIDYLANPAGKAKEAYIRAMTDPAYALKLMEKAQTSGDRDVGDVLLEVLRDPAYVGTNIGQAVIEEDAQDQGPGR